MTTQPTLTAEQCSAGAACWYSTLSRLSCGCSCLGQFHGGDARGEPRPPWVPAKKAKPKPRKAKTKVTAVSQPSPSVTDASSQTQGYVYEPQQDQDEYYQETP